MGNLLPRSGKNEPSLPLDESPGPSDIKEVFIQALKQRYKIQYDAIQPIPYIKDRLYCVDKVFVEGGIETHSVHDDSWLRVNSYKNFFSEIARNRSLRIIEAEAGYGKSTITLQLAYDWCNGVQESPLGNKEILILLRLRQLGGFNSIYQAIKQLLVPTEARITSSDIKDIIEGCSSVEILLDGYDEYPNRESDTEDDVSRIITREMFADISVSLTTRYLPNNYDRTTTNRARLLGFDDEARDQYIRKAVTGDNDSKVLKIKRALKENPILDDLCQVPLLFVMFAHMTHEKKDFRKLKSVTDFFRFMLKCFHSHMRNKSKDKNTKRYMSEFEFQFRELSQIAFEGLSKENQQLTWDKQELHERLGVAFYEYYVSVGILVEEQLADVTNEQSLDENTFTKVEVRFYHKLFCEYYASFTLTEKAQASQNKNELFELLDKLDPFDLQYLYRFSCGQDPATGNKIIQYLKGTDGGDKFAILCILEQTGDVDDIKENVKDLCSESVHIRYDDNKLIQRSLPQLMEIAAKYKIPISRLVLDRSLIAVGETELSLSSGYHLEVMSSLEKLEIKTSKGRVFTMEEFLTMLTYAVSCDKLTRVSLIDCVLPPWVPAETLSDIPKAKDLTVLWRPTSQELQLESYIGTWTMNTGDTLSFEVTDHPSWQELCARRVTLRKNERLEKSRTSILLLEIASHHNMSVTSLALHESLVTANETEITLESRLQVPSLSCITELEIISDSYREYTAEETIGVIKYGNMCQQLLSLRFVSCLMPLSLPGECLSPTSRSEQLKVSWRLHEYDFQLTRSKWQLSSKDSSSLASDDLQKLSKICSDSICLQEDDNKHRQGYNILLLENASFYEIPVFCVVCKQSVINVHRSGLTLSTGLLVPVLSTMERLEIREDKPKEYTPEEFKEIISYCQQCIRLKTLTFLNCVLPLFCPVEFLSSVTDSLRSEVLWSPLSDYFSLDSKSGQWTMMSDQKFKLNVQDVQSLSKMCSESVILHNDECYQSNKMFVLLLEIASKHEIFISCLVLDNSLLKADKLGIKIKSGVCIPILLTLQNLRIKGEKGEELSHEKFLGIVSYVQTCPKLTELTFIDCLLPLSFSDETLLSDIRDNGLRVFWRPSSLEVCLDDSNGKWEMKTNDQSIWIEYDGNKTLTELCESRTFLRRTDSHKLQRTMILLLEIASNHQIPIYELCLKWSFRGFDGDNIRLESGLCISSLSSVEKISISGGIDKNEISEGEVTGLLNFGVKSRRFQELWFNNCKLPPSINPASIPEEAKSRNAKVFSSNDALSFNLETGEWTEPEDIETITTMCSDGLVINNRTSKSAQRSVIELLVKAANHDIPISQVDLILSFDKIAEDGRNIILKSGLLLPNISSMEVMLIQTEKGREMKEEEVNGILNYLQQNKRLKALYLGDCVLPSRIRLGPAADTLRSRNVKVFWIPNSNRFHQQRLLDLTRGHWDKVGSW